jgi:hypothetical protein
MSAINYLAKRTITKRAHAHAALAEADLDQSALALEHLR